MSEVEEAAHKIMALVDEFPSEPFSYDRKRVMHELELLLSNFADMSNEAKDSYYQVGYDDGWDEGHQQATDEYESKIQDLEDKLGECEEALQGKLDESFAEGFETARIEYGIN